LGKPAGNDLVEGVYTLPVIYALQEESAGRELRGLLGGPIETPERDKARDIIRSSHGVDAAITAGKNFSQQAIDALGALRDTEMTRNLGELARDLFSFDN
jgi:heptaprenyl diphosphate synthase